MADPSRFALCVLLAACGGGASATHAPSTPCPAVSAAPSSSDGDPMPALAPVAPVASALATLDGARMKADVVRLAGFGTRHTLSDTASETRGIGAARRWLETEMRRAAGPSAQVVAEPHLVKADGKRVATDVSVVDVVATFPGASATAASRRVYVVAHYDSRCTDVMDATHDAPGANDDASGVAILLELARLLAPLHLESTVVLLATAGEEQGLLGAKEHVATLTAPGAARVVGVLNDDIVGDPAGADPHVVRVFAKGDDDGPGRELQRYVAEVSAREHLDATPRLVFRADRVLRGGDHLPFSEAGFAAVRFTASGEAFDRQHQDLRIDGAVVYGDTVDHVDPGYLATVARMNAATLLHLADAPEPPSDAQLVAELSNDVHLRWSPSRDADVASYEVVWRDTTSPRWQHARDVGKATDVHLPASKDDWFFGVRAVDAGGHRSLVSPAKPVAAAK